MRGPVSKGRLVSIVLIVSAMLLGIALVLFTSGNTPNFSPRSQDVSNMFGVHEQYQDGPNRTTPKESKTRYPLMTITREFKGGVIKPQNLIPSLTNLCHGVWNEGMACNVSFKFSKAEVLNGQWKPFIDQAVSYLKDSNLSRQTVLTIWHEPEDDATDSFRGKRKTFDNGADFVNYFDTVHNWVKRIDPNLTTSHAALGYGYRPKRGGPSDNSAWVTDPSQWVTQADVQAIDIYSGRSFALADGLGTSTAFKRWYASRPEGSLWGVSERGWITGKYGGNAERVQAIKAEFDYLASLPVADLPSFYIVWTTEGTENDPNIILDESGRQAVNDGFALLDAKMNPQPEPTPEPEPSQVQCPTCCGVGTIPSTWKVTTTIENQR